MVILDTSAAVEIAMATEHGMALKSFITADEPVISCVLMRAEAASAARSRRRKDSLSLQVAQGIFRDACGVVDEFVPIEDLEEEALHESMRLDHSVYDMFYFVLARRTGGTLFTTDRNLMKLCEEQHLDCIHEVELC